MMGLTRGIANVQYSARNTLNIVLNPEYGLLECSSFLLCLWFKTIEGYCSTLIRSGLLIYS